MTINVLYNDVIMIITLYLPSAVFIAQRLVGPSKQLKQIIQIEQNIVKEESQLAGGKQVGNVQA